jgi:hypothetical protein
MDSLDRTMSNMVAFVQKAAGAVRRHVLDKVRDLRPSPIDFGADPTGTNDSTAAFVAVRAATYGVYQIPTGLYLTDAATLDDRFSAETNAQIKVGATTYDVSCSFCGRWTYQAGGGVIQIKDAVTGYVPFSAGATGTLGFYGTSPVSKPTVTGTTKDTGTVALANALAALGLITNNLTYVAP